MNNIMCFYCDMCEDKIARNRKGLRLHLKTHVRNELMNSKTSGEGAERTWEKQKWWHKEELF